MIKDYLRCGATIDDNIGRLLRYLDEKDWQRIPSSFMYQTKDTSWENMDSLINE